MSSAQAVLTAATAMYALTVAVLWIEAAEHLRKVRR